MLFLLFGSSAAGKTVTLNALRGQVPELAMHDFDEIGVPADADTAWRHRADEEWVQRALGYQAAGIDLLLAGETPIGERARGPEWLARVPGQLEDYFNWADWMRAHAADPQWMPEVIQVESSKNEMYWARWNDWRAGDPRWRVRMLDTSARPVEEVAKELAGWIAEERASFRAGRHPLSGTALAP